MDQQFTINAQHTVDPSEIALNAEGVTQEILDVVMTGSSPLALRLDGSILYVTVKEPPGAEIEMSHVMNLHMSCLLAAKALEKSKANASKTGRDRMLERIATNTGLSLG